MPQLLPFRGLRPDPAVVGPLDDFVCPPYDVITAGQRRALVARSPYNVVRVELPDGRYDVASALLRQWRSSGALVREASPALYGYRMTSPTGVTLGVIGALVLEPPGHGILPHEQTTPKARSDRLELIRAAEANTSPIWCLCTEPGLVAALGEVPRDEVATALDDDGNKHETWPLASPAVHRAVARVVGAGPLLVADGHHRYETALTYQAEQVAKKAPGASESPVGLAGYDAVLALVVELAEQSLQIMAIHRVVSGLPPGADVPGAFRPEFEVSPFASEDAQLLDEMGRENALAIVTSEGAVLARPLPGSAPARLELDSSRADTALASLPPHQLSYEHDVAHALAEVREGSADAAVLCRPASVAQIAQTAHGGARMPPKTTFFWPKPRTGMVLRDW